MVLNRALLISAVCLFSVTLAEASRSRLQPVSSNRHFDVLVSLGVEELPEGSMSFGLEQESFIRGWFLQQAKLGKLPSELTSHEAPPPLRRDAILPADLRERVQPLPLALERQLPTLTGNLRRVIVLGDVVLLEEDTARIVDLIPDVL